MQYSTHKSDCSSTKGSIRYCPTKIIRQRFPWPFSNQHLLPSTLRLPPIIVKVELQSPNSQKKSSTFYTLLKEISDILSNYTKMKATTWREQLEYVWIFSLWMKVVLNSSTFSWKVNTKNVSLIWEIQMLVRPIKNRAREIEEHSSYRNSQL